MKLKKTSDEILRNGVSWRWNKNSSFIPICPYLCFNLFHLFFFLISKSKFSFFNFISTSQTIKVVCQNELSTSMRVRNRSFDLKEEKTMSITAKLSSL